MQTIIISVIAALAIGIGIAVPLLMNNDSSGTVNNEENVPLAKNETDSGSDRGFSVLQDSDLPAIDDPNLRVQKVAEGLAMPTSMAFLSEDDVLVLQKDNGRVRYIQNGELQDDPIHDVFVNEASERGLLGIAVGQADNSTENRELFLYYTEDVNSDVRNRVYQYEYSQEAGVSGGNLVLDLPGTPGPNHDGGKLAIGPDGMLYAVIGDLNRNGRLQNHPDGAEPDDTSVILRVDYSGNGASDNPFSDQNAEIADSVSKYFAYGIRNSFGIAFDPVTGHLWDTENGPSGYDEINLVLPGFNSGWEQVMGPIERTDVDESELVDFSGSHYRDPAFSWRSAQGITDIEFFNSTSLGEEYSNNIFVGDINNGRLYYFEVNDSRDGLSLGSSGLDDLVADNDSEMDSVTLGSGFGGITDIETGPDGYLYILSFSGDLYRILPNP